MYFLCICFIDEMNKRTNEQTSLKQFMVLLRCKFFSASFLHLKSKTLIACMDMQLRFFRVKTIVKQCL